HYYSSPFSASSIMVCTSDTVTKLLTAGTSSSVIKLLTSGTSSSVIKLLTSGIDSSIKVCTSCSVIKFSISDCLTYSFKLGVEAGNFLILLLIKTPTSLSV